MNGVKNGVTLIGKLNKYAGGAMDTIYKAISNATEPIIDRAANIDFAGSFFDNPAIPEYNKILALHRNIFADERAEGNLSHYPMGKKPEIEMNKKGILAALVVLAAAGGGYAISKKYDIGMDDISATIAYLEANTIGTFSEMITADSPANNLAEPIKAPTPPANESETKAKKKYTYPQDTYQFTPDVKFFGNETFHKELWKNNPTEPGAKMTYEEAGQKALEDFKNTPDFTIDVDGVQMPVYDFVMKYMDEMHEGPEGSDPDGLHKIGTGYFPTADANIILHLAIHESGIDMKYADSLYDREKNFRENKYAREEFATRIQINWLAVKNNWTLQHRNEVFEKAMMTYDNILHGDGR